MSIPLASPLMIKTCFFASAFAMSAAALRPMRDAFRDPTIATLGLGIGISMGPETKISGGACFSSTSLSGPSSCSAVRLRNVWLNLVSLVVGSLEIVGILSLHELDGSVPPSSTRWVALLRGYNTTLSKWALSEKFYLKMNRLRILTGPPQPAPWHRNTPDLSLRARPSLPGLSRHVSFPVEIIFSLD